MIDTEGIPALGLPPSKAQIQPGVSKRNTHINDYDEAEKLVEEAYNRKTTLAGEELRNECSMAYKMLK